MSRLRKGELLAGVGALALLVLLFTEWFAIGGEGLRDTAQVGELTTAGYDSLGWAMVGLLLTLVFLAFGLVASTVSRQPVAWAVSATVMTSAVGIITTLVLLLRFAFQPDLGVGAPDEVVTLEGPAYLGLLAVALTTFGAWWAMGDERTHARESAYEPPPARPVPGAEPS